MQQIPSPNFRAGRIKPIRLIVLHTAETPCEDGRAVEIANYLARPTVQASAHYCVDPSETVQGVQEGDTAWAAPGGNADGIQIEQAGYAGSTDWGSAPAQKMIYEQLVPLVAGICQRHNIPVVALDTAAVAAGAAGITAHVCVSEAFRLSDHWDCGPHYPLNDVVAAVNTYLNPPAPEPAPEPAPTPDPTPDPSTNEQGDEMSVAIITPTLRPGGFEGRDVWDMVISGPATMGRTKVDPMICIMPVHPEQAVDPGFTVDIHCNGPDGSNVKTVTVSPAVTFVPVPFTGRVSVVADPKMPVIVTGREVHHAV